MKKYEGVMKKMRRLKYEKLRQMVYNEELRAAYLCSSVTGGELKGRNVLVTGGNGGIGSAIAMRFLCEGCNVTITGRSEEKLKNTVEYIKSKIRDAPVDYILADQASEESIYNCMNELDKRGLRMDILVNNAGICSDVDRARRFRTVNQDEFYTVWNTNYNGTVKITNAIAKRMVDSDIDGAIINIASICAYFRKFQYTPYGMSKAAVIAFSDELRKFYPSLNISTIAPGSVATTMGDINIKFGDNIARNCNTLHHLALPEEIAALAAFLAGSVGKTINQTVIASACEVL